MDAALKRRLGIFAVMVAVFVAAVIVVGLAVPAASRFWRQEFLRSPNDVPYSPEGAVKRTIERLKDE